MYPRKNAKILEGMAARMAARLGIGKGCYTATEESIVMEWFQTVGTTVKGHKVKLPMKLTVETSPMKLTATWEYQGVVNVTTAEPSEWRGVEASLVTKLKGLRYDHCVRALNMRGNGSEALFLKRQREVAELHARLDKAMAAVATAQQEVDRLRQQIYYAKVNR